MCIRDRLDTKGPEIRLKDFKNGVENLVAGQTFTLTLSLIHISSDARGSSLLCSYQFSRFAAVFPCQTARRKLRRIVKSFAIFPLDVYKRQN